MHYESKKMGVKVFRIKKQDLSFFFKYAPESPLIPTVTSEIMFFVLSKNGRT